MERIGFIGLGNMGRPMASNLRRKGHAVVVYDVDASRMEALERLGAGRATDCTGVAQGSDVVFTMLPNSAIVETVLAGEGGVLRHLPAGGVVVDMSTVDPLVTDRMALLAAAKGIEFVDAPVGRLASHAERGECLFMVGVIHGTTATNGQLKIAWPAKVLKGDTEPGFTIDLAHKDLTLIVDAANAVSVPMPIGAAARESFNAARGQGYGARDFSAMADVICDTVRVTKPRLG